MIRRIDENTIERETKQIIKRQPLVQMKKALEFKLSKIEEELKYFEETLEETK